MSEETDSPEKEEFSMSLEAIEVEESTTVRLTNEKRIAPVRRGRRFRSR